MFQASQASETNTLELHEMEEEEESRFVGNGRQSRRVYIMPIRKVCLKLKNKSGFLKLGFHLFQVKSSLIVKPEIALGNIFIK